MRRPVMTIHAIHRAMFAGFELLFRGRHVARDVFDGLALVIGVIDNRDDLPLIVDRDVADTRTFIEVPSMNSHRPLPSVAANLEQHRGRLRSVLLVVLVCGFHHELVAGETLRPMALLAGFPGRTEILHRSVNGPRVSVKNNRENLAHAGELGAHEPSRAWTDVAFHTVDAGVRGILIGGKLRNHDRVTGLAAELCGVHIFHAAVRSRSKDEDVHKRCRSDDEDAMTYHRLAKIDRRINVRKPAPGLELMVSQQNADGDEQQTKDENSRQNQEKQNPYVRMGRSWKQEIIKPEGDERNCSAGRKRGANESDQVLSQIVKKPNPARKRFAKSHRVRCPPFFSFGKRKSLLTAPTSSAGSPVLASK